MLLYTQTHSISLKTEIQEPALTGICWLSFFEVYKIATLVLLIQ